MLDFSRLRLLATRVASPAWRIVVELRLAIVDVEGRVAVNTLVMSVRKIRRETMMAKICCIFDMMDLNGSMKIESKEILEIRLRVLYMRSWPPT